MNSTVVVIGFNQSEVHVTEGMTEEAVVCAEVTSGRLDRNVTIYLKTVPLNNSGQSNYYVKLPVTNN